MNKTEWTHPELQEGEVFIGNVTTEVFNGSWWIDKRLGNVAYDINGISIMKGRDFFPMFVNRQEIEKAGVYPDESDPYGRW